MAYCRTSARPPFAAAASGYTWRGHKGPAEWKAPPRVTRSRTGVKLGAGAALAALPACEGATSTLDPAGPGAARIEGLWWLVFWIAVSVFVIVMAFLFAALLRSRRREVEVSREVSWGEPFIVISGVILPSLVLIAVFALSLRDVHELSRPGEQPALEIEVVGHDWWWEVRYPNGAITANEIHIPVDEPVRLNLRTGDVIHSFWVPRLQGKTDNISGRVNHMWLEADRPGRYRGQCAEFCGLQHAKMAFYVVAESRATFDAWADRAAEPRRPVAGSAAAGQAVFLSSTCVGCHAVGGTTADARVGPDLTHLADRRTLFAGTVPNTERNLARIITDPQSVKPGAAMPPTQLSPGELQDLISYLGQLD
jgi:cytochrome c oxidase subunit 2